MNEEEHKAQLRDQGRRELFELTADLEVFRRWKIAPDQDALIAKMGQIALHVAGYDCELEEPTQAKTVPFKSKYRQGYVAAYTGHPYRDD